MTDPQNSLPFVQQGLRTELTRRSHRHISRRTPHGRIDISIWNVSNISHISTIENGDKCSAVDIAATVTISPDKLKKSSFRIEFEFTPLLDPLAKITYQPIIPNESAVFEIVQTGSVRQLIQLIEAKKERAESGPASLAVRDEEGRSLLNVSLLKEDS